MSFTPNSPLTVQAYAGNLGDIEIPMFFFALIDELLMNATLEKKTELEVSFDLMYQCVFVDGPARSMLDANQLFNIYKEGVAKAYRTAGWVVSINNNSWFFNFQPVEVKAPLRFSVVSKLPALH